MGDALVCLDCEQALDFLDTVVNRRMLDHHGRKVVYRLYICHNEECDHYGQIYNDSKGELTEGDPAGLY